MGKYKYSKDEKRINRILKMNQDESLTLLNDDEMEETRRKADDEISSSYQLLKELGLSEELKESDSARREKLHITRRDYSDIVDEAGSKYGVVELEDILSESEIRNAVNDLTRIELEFSKKISRT